MNIHIEARCKIVKLPLKDRAVHESSHVRRELGADHLVTKLDFPDGGIRFVEKHSVDGRSALLTYSYSSLEVSTRADYAGNQAKVTVLGRCLSSNDEIQGLTHEISPEKALLEHLNVVDEIKTLYRAQNSSSRQPF